MPKGYGTRTPPQVVLQLGFPITGGGTAVADAGTGSCNAAITTISAAAVAGNNSTAAAEACDIVGYKMCGPSCCSYYCSKTRTQ